MKTETSVAATRSRLYTSIRKDLSQSTGTIRPLMRKKGEREGLAQNTCGNVWAREEKKENRVRNTNKEKK